MAGASVQQSSDGARWPLMSFRFSSAIRLRLNPESSLATARSRRYGQATGICSSATLRSQPPKIGIQYPKRISELLSGPRPGIFSGLRGLVRGANLLQQAAEVAGHRGQGGPRGGGLDAGVVVGRGVHVVGDQPAVRGLDELDPGDA